MAEKEQVHRHYMEKTEIDTEAEVLKQISSTDSRNSLIGIIAGFLIAAIAFGCGTYAIVSGFDIAGTLIGGFGIGSLVSAFIQGKKESKKDQTEEEDEGTTGRMPTG